MASSDGGKDFIEETSVSVTPEGQDWKRRRMESSV